MTWIKGELDERVNGGVEYYRRTRGMTKQQCVEWLVACGLDAELTEDEKAKLND